MGEQVVPESWLIPRALSDETLRLLTSLPEDEIQRRLRMDGPAVPEGREPAAVEKCLIEPPSWCDDGQAHAWCAGWEARDEMLLQPWPPVPVSERLPGPKDCMPHPRTKRGNWCWGFERCEVSLARPARWRLMHVEAVEMEASHWLPANALPLPEAKP